MPDLLESQPVTALLGRLTPDRDIGRGIIDRDYYQLIIRRSLKIVGRCYFSIPGTIPFYQQVRMKVPVPYSLAVGKTFRRCLSVS